MLYTVLILPLGGEIVKNMKLTSRHQAKST
jgi:hypothetical protein